MPLNPEILGTEKDGSKSKLYCKFCYNNGSFTHSFKNVEEMRAHIMGVMDKEKMPADIVEAAVSRLPFLERWKKKPLGRKRKQVSATEETVPEKYPLQEPPGHGTVAVSEEDLEIISGEEPDETDPGYSA